MDLLLWQLADSAFPAGGFPHSAGLEAAMQHGEVTGRDDLENFTRAVIRQAARGALPFVTAAHADPGGILSLDARCDAFLSNPVTNRASRGQGQAFLTACARSFGRGSVEQLQRTIRESHMGGHYAPVFGAALRALEVDRPRAQRLFLFLTGRTVTSAAVRLGLVGTYEAQQLQNAMVSEIMGALDRCAALGPAEIAQIAPLIDVFQSTHDRLYSRLFQS